MDSWYATTLLFKDLKKKGKYFYCPAKSNHLVDESEGQLPYQALVLLTWSAQEVARGKLVKVRVIPKGLKLKRWSVLVFTHRTDTSSPTN